jgi:hypothetical protein
MYVTIMYITKHVRNFVTTRCNFLYKIIKLYIYIYWGQFCIVTKKNGNLFDNIFNKFLIYGDFLLKEKINSLLGREILDTYQWLL